jgi:glycerophosphoryl diester phosphodiesterase
MNTVPRSAPALVCHKGLMDSHAFPPNSLEAVEACLRAGAAHVEIDVVALADGDYLLVHDWTLEAETTGSGPTGACTAAQAGALRIRDRGRETPYRVPVLSDVVALFARHGGATKLQVDYKNLIPFPDPEPLARLARIVQPLGERVRVSSAADWQLRRLRALAPWLAVGLEVQFYLDWEADPAARDPRAYPRQRGAYGYYDDHPVAARRIWSAADYLWDRCQFLIGLAPGADMFYMNHRLLAQSLADGFNWAAALHRAGIRLDAWTLDATDPVAMANLPLLAAAGVDQVTSNTPAAVARALG